MQLLRSSAATAKLCRRLPKPVVLVPTMGALHRGHVALIKRARKLAGPKGSVVVSIFVNPTQFGPKEDLGRYPRPFAQDRQICESNGADLLFAPAPAEIYPPGFSTFIEPGPLAEGLCGRSRPGHFRGVCTVVAKLFNITGAHIAVFGQKDYQQLAVIRRMTSDLNLPVKIVGVPTVRESDGLALSSRNKYLTEEERRQAAVIRKALLAARNAGRSQTVAVVRRMVAGQIRRAPIARIEYIELVDPTTLAVATKRKGPLLLAVAVRFGGTRLIDNILLP